MLNVSKSPGDERVDGRLTDFGERVAALREQAALTQAQLAESAGMDRGFLGSVERGDRNIGLVKVFALSDALGVDAVELFTD